MLNCHLLLLFFEHVIRSIALFCIPDTIKLAAALITQDRDGTIKRRRSLYLGIDSGARTDCASDKGHDRSGGCAARCFCWDDWAARKREDRAIREHRSKERAIRDLRPRKRRSLRD